MAVHNNFLANLNKYSGWLHHKYAVVRAGCLHAAVYFSSFALAACPEVTLTPVYNPQSHVCCSGLSFEHTTNELWFSQFGHSASLRRQTQRQTDLYFKSSSFAALTDANRQSAWSRCKWEQWDWGASTAATRATLTWQASWSVRLRSWLVRQTLAVSIQQHSEKFNTITAFDKQFQLKATPVYVQAQRPTRVAEWAAAQPYSPLPYYQFSAVAAT